jgi:hypothetical protein
MSRIKVILLSMLAVFAFSAVATATASAKRVWTTACTEVKAGTGEFTESKCATKVKTKGEAAGKFEKGVLPVGTSKELKLTKTNESFKLTAGTEVIKCEVVTLTTGAIENVLVETLGPTGRDKGTDTFTKCTNTGKPNCKVTEPIVVEGTTVLAENSAGSRIYDVFLPKEGKELTPAEITKFEDEKTGKATTEQEKLFAYTKIKQTGEESGVKCVETTQVEGDGVGAEFVNSKGEPEESESVTKILKFPATPITPVKLWNGLTITLKLKGFGVAATEVGQGEIELAGKLAFDVE